MSLPKKKVVDFSSGAAVQSAVQSTVKGARPHARVRRPSGEMTARAGAAAQRERRGGRGGARRRSREKRRGGGRAERNAEGGWRRDCSKEQHYIHNNFGCAIEKYPIETQNVDSLERFFFPSLPAQKIAQKGPRKTPLKDPKRGLKTCPKRTEKHAPKGPKNSPQKDCKKASKRPRI